MSRRRLPVEKTAAGLLLALALALLPAAYAAWALVRFPRVGAIQCYSGSKTVDWGSLNDRYLAQLLPGLMSDNIAQRRAACRGRAAYVFGKKQAAFVLTSSVRGRVVRDPSTWIPIGSADPRRLTEDPRFAGYTLARTFSLSEQEGYHEIV